MNDAWRAWEAFVIRGLRWLMDGQPPAAQWAIWLSIATVSCVVSVLCVVHLAGRVT